MCAYVTTFFAPFVANTKLAIEELGEGIHEVQSKKFIMRIRRGTGHRNDILVTILATAERPANNDDLSKEIGLAVLAEFRGETLAESPFDTEEAYLRAAAELARAAEKLILPYLLGHRTDFTDLKKFVAARAEKALREIPDYRFPKNVRKEWI